MLRSGHNVQGSQKSHHSQGSEGSQGKKRKKVPSPQKSPKKVKETPDVLSINDQSIKMDCSFKKSIKTMPKNFSNTIRPDEKIIPLDTMTENESTPSSNEGPSYPNTQDPQLGNPQLAPNERTPIQQVSLSKSLPSDETSERANFGLQRPQSPFKRTSSPPSPCDGPTIPFVDESSGSDQDKVSPKKSSDTAKAKEFDSKEKFTSTPVVPDTGKSVITGQVRTGWL